MNRIATTLVCAAAILGLLAAPLMAQTMPQEKQVEGPVKKIDPATKTVEVGRLFGLLTTKLEVTDGTSISIEGKKGSLEDLQQGARVKASYEAEGGKNIATSIEVMPPKTKATGAQSAQ